MPKLIKMPKLSDTMTEGTLAKWHIKEGDSVEMGKVIADVETDKATMEMQAFEEGKVFKLISQAGNKVPLGGTMVVLLAEGEEAPADLDALIAGSDAPAPSKKEDAPAKSDRPAGGKAAFSGSLPPSAPGQKKRPAVASANGVRVKASPLARKVAEE
ncbi:MAG: biotin/lipoyl-containing protein, partial [Verrucomicrobium sp.]|nr:biotin/lipoyl-containing protein [Verrucomicrobium sp.]